VRLQRRGAVVLGRSRHKSSEYSVVRAGHNLLPCYITCSLSTG
jgi:hypothetical protein